MIESGFVKLVQSGLGSPPMAPGGYGVMLPKDAIAPATPKAWVYYSTSSEPTYTLAGQDGLTEWHVSIDCHGYTMADAIALARAIDGVLRGAPAAILPDADNTVMQGAFRMPGFIDGYSDANRSFVRTLEYKIVFNQI